MAVNRHQVLWIGLWTEADNQGVFEFKPTTLKVRLRAASTRPVEPLLAELVEVDVIWPFEIGRRKYGAIRNFQPFQRPKKPNAVHVLPPGFREYVGSSEPSSEPKPVKRMSSSEPKPSEPVQSSELKPAEVVPGSEPVPNSPPVEPPPVPQKSEIAPQMEDGGGTRGDGVTPSLRSVAAADASGELEDLGKVCWREGTKLLKSCKIPADEINTLLGSLSRDIGTDHAALLAIVRRASKETRWTGEAPLRI